MKGIGELLRVNLKVTVGLVIAFLMIILLIISCSVSDDNRDFFRDIILIVGSSAAVYSAWYVGLGLKRKNDHEKLKASFDILQMLNDPTFVEVLDYLESTMKKTEKLTQEQIKELLTNNPKESQFCRVILGFLEDMSIAIQFGYAEEEPLYYSLRAIVDISQRTLIAYIDDRRKNQPDYCTELRKLHVRWTEKRKLFDGGKLEEQLEKSN